MLVTHQQAAPPSQQRPWLERRLRALPVRWRIMSIAVLNSALALVLLVLVWDGAAGLSSAWTDLRQVRQSERLLITLDSEGGRLQSLIHRYFTQPNPAVLAEIVRRRDALLSQLQAQGLADPSLAASTQELISITERFLQGFEDLRAVRASLSAIYEGDILEPAKDMAGLYAILDSTTESREALVRPSLGKSREAYNAMLLAANAYYLTLSQERGEEAKRYAVMIERAAPVSIDLAETELQRNALAALRDRAAAVRRGLDLLAEQVTQQTRLLSESIDSNAAAMSAATDRLKMATAERERAAQDRFDRALSAVSSSSRSARSRSRRSSRATEAGSVSLPSASFSTRIRSTCRCSWSSSTGRESISIRSREAASSIRSMALSGRNRSLMYRSDSPAAATSAASVICTR